MSKGKLITKLIFKAAVIICLITIAVILASYETIILNNVAMGQMTNSDEAYILMANYKNIKTTVEIVITIVIYFIFGTSIHNVYKFFKSNNTSDAGATNEKEI